MTLPNWSWYAYVDADEELHVVAPDWVEVVVLHRGGVVCYGDRRLKQPADELVMPGLDEEPLVLQGRVPPSPSNLVCWENGDKAAVAVEDPGEGGYDPPVVLVARRDEDEVAGNGTEEGAEG